MSGTFYVTYNSSSDLLALNQDGRIGRIRKFSLRVFEQESGFCVRSTSVFDLNTPLVGPHSPFIALHTSAFF